MDPAIRHVVDQIVRLVDPLEITLFGSAARGERARDLDLMVLMPNGTHRRDTVRKLYAHLRDVDVPVDIVVATPQDLARHKDNVGLIYRAILREGRSVYISTPSGIR